VTNRKPSRLGLVLAASFIFSLIMAVGPGVLLVNRPTTVCGIPLVYAWGLLWYAVIVAIAVIANACLWSRQNTLEDAAPERADRVGTEP
jgi:hypothetical protein